MAKWEAPPVTILYLVRHGETDYNRNGRYQGQLDIPLNAEGRRQSLALADRMVGLPLDLIYTSDLAWAQETARTVAAGRTAVLDNCSLTVIEWSGGRKQLWSLNDKEQAANPQDPGTRAHGD
jgi:bisphosphoglycerate-dependent phosphoglycerate mutase